MSDNVSDPDPVKETPQEKSLVDDIRTFVHDMLDQWHPQKIAERKVIHDPILGSNIFEPYEIAIIDSPFCQRLRRVSQTDVASLVFPSANHNRLEHSLGVATIAGRILESLKLKQINGAPSCITDTSCIEIRIAAILHDIGHGVFSHLSEELYQGFPEVAAHYKNNPSKFDQDKPHEMIGHLIIKDSQFQNFLTNEIVKQYNLPDINFDNIANFLIPIGGKHDINGWQADIINGPFDADKFDYIQRDAYFSGLKLGIDLDRFLHCVWLDSEPGKPRQLKMMTTGSTTIEQILFAKLMLYSTIYYHQKIRAAECGIKGIFEIISSNRSNPDYRILNRKMDRAIDYLYTTEEDILSLNNKPKEISTYIGEFLNRQLFKRALVISTDTVEKPSISPGYQVFKSLAENPNRLNDLRKELAGELKGKYPLHKIWIDLPQTLTFTEALFARIQDEGNEPKYLSETFRVAEWLTAYASNKWKAYVFCSCDSNTDREYLGRKAAELISSKYQFAIKVDDAINQSKIR